MTLKRLTAAAAACAMIAMPSIAAAATTASGAQALSLSSTARVGAATANKNDITRQGTIIGGILVLGIVAGGIIAIANDDDKPNSP